MRIERNLRARPHMRNHLRRSQGTQPCTLGQRQIAREAIEEARGEKIAGACQIDHLRDRMRLDDMNLIALDDDASGFRACQRRD